MVFTVRTRRAGLKGHAPQSEWSWPRIALILVLCSGTFFLGHHHASSGTRPVGSIVALRDEGSGNNWNRTDTSDLSSARLRATRALLEKERQEAAKKLAQERQAHAAKLEQERTALELQLQKERDALRNKTKEAQHQLEDMQTKYEEQQKTAKEHELQRAKEKEAWGLEREKLQAAREPVKAAQERNTRLTASPAAHDAATAAKAKAVVQSEEPVKKLNKAQWSALFKRNLKKAVNTETQSIVCGLIKEEWPKKYRQLVLRCPGAGTDPAAKIEEILFASYGGPLTRHNKDTSDCPSYWYRDWCHSTNSMKVLERACLDRAECRILLAGKAFGDDPCPGKQKLLGAVVRCGKTPSDSKGNIATTGGAPTVKYAHNHNVHLFVVNLRRRTDRRKKIEKVLASSTVLSGMKTTWIGVEGANMDLAKLWMEGKLAPATYKSVIRREPVVGTDPTSGSLGCSFSHYEIWQKCAALQATHRLCLALEDDIELLPKFDSRFTQELGRLPDDTDLWYPASMMSSDPLVVRASKPLDSLFVKMSGATWGTYAYAIAPIAAAELANTFFPLYKQVDTFIMDRYQASQWTVVRSKQNLLSTDNAEGRDSDVQSYKAESMIMPKNVLVIMADGSVGNKEALSSVRRAGTLLDVHEKAKWKTVSISAKEMRNEIASVVARECHVPHNELAKQLDSSADSGRCSATIACLMALHVHGGVCIIDHDVTAQQSLNGILKAVGFFGAYEYDGAISTRIFGAKKGHSILSELLPLLVQSKCTAEVLQQTLHDQVVGKLSKDVVLFAPHLFTPLPYFGERYFGQYDKDSVLVFSKNVPVEQEIPHTLHFIQLFRKSFDDQAMRCIRSWMQLHPAWHIRIWTDDDIDSLAMKDLIHAAQHPAQKADLMRYEVIYNEGGVYVDTDIECFRPIDDLVRGTAGLVCHEDIVDYEAHDYLANGLLAASKNHPIMRRAEPLSRTVRLNTFDVAMQTGPALWSKILGPDIDKFRTLPRETFYPVRFQEREVLSKNNCYKKSCQMLYPQSHGLHLYAPTISWDHKFVAKPPVQKYLDNFKALSLEIQDHNKRAANLQGSSSGTHAKRVEHIEKQKQNNDQKPIHDEER